MFTESQYVRVITDKPALVTYFPRSTSTTTAPNINWPAMTIAPPRGQWMSSYTFVIPNDKTFVMSSYVYIIIENVHATKDGLRNNGNPIETTGWANIKDTTLVGKAIQVHGGFRQVITTFV